MPKEFRGLLSGEISRIDSKTEFKGKSISNAARKAIVVSPHDKNQPKEEILSIDGENIRVVTYRIYIEESVGNSELGTLIYPMPGTQAEADYLAEFPESEREYQRKQLLMSSTKIGYFKRDETIGEIPGYGSEVFATPIQNGLLSDRFMITSTGTKHKLNGSRGLAPSKPDPDFSKLAGQEKFFNKNGKPVNSISAGKGSVSLMSDNVNYACLTDDVKQKIQELANAGFDLVISSAYRTAADAARVGSTTNSKHSTGQGVDFRVNNFVTAGKQLNEEGQRLVREAKKLGFKYPVSIDHGTGLHFHFEYTDGPKQSSQQCSEEALSSFYANEETGNT